MDFRRFAKTNIIILGVLTFFAGGLFFGAVTKREFSFSAIGLNSTFANVSYTEKVNEGIGMLKSSAPLEYKTSNGKDSGSLIEAQIALAILDRKSGEVLEKRYWLDEKDRSYELRPVSENEDVIVSIKWWNAFNSLYEIDSNKNMIVVANKYLISREYLPEQEALLATFNGPDSRYFNMVYAPYSEAIHGNDLVARGIEYVNYNIDTAFAELDKLGVKSKVDESKLLTEVVSKDMLRNIILTEHVDVGALAFADDDGRQLAERVLIILGANREWAYRYTNSPAGANGLAQFIEPSYFAMIRNYPDAGLINDHRLGMADHTNAMKAMALYFDVHERILMDRIKDKELFTSLDLDPLLAAAYNGGPARVIDAVLTDKKAWAISEKMREETRSYVSKFGKIQNLSIF